MSTSSELAMSALAKRVARLEQRVARGERQRKLFFVAGAALIVLVAILLAIVVYLWIGRIDARTFYNRQDQDTDRKIHQLVCSLPSNNPTSDQLRGEYQCPSSSSPAAKS